MCKVTSKRIFNLLLNTTLLITETLSRTQRIIKLISLVLIKLIIEQMKKINKIQSNSKLIQKKHSLYWDLKPNKKIQNIHKITKLLN